jgi:DNA-binding response OmpR family regulator
MKRILVIEDDTDLADLLGTLLQLQGYGVEVAYDGSEGLAKIRAQPFDLVVTDLMMPSVSGWEVLEELRRSPEHSAIPVIVMSALAAGSRANGYGHSLVTKPFNLDTMLSTIEGLIGPSD